MTSPREPIEVTTRARYRTEPRANEPFVCILEFRGNEFMGRSRGSYRAALAQAEDLIRELLRQNQGRIGPPDAHIHQFEV